MTWDELTQARLDLGFTEDQMWTLLGVAKSTYTGWRTREKVPDYIANSVAAHLRLGAKAVYELLLLRRGECDEHL